MSLFYSIVVSFHLMLCYLPLNSIMVHPRDIFFHFCLTILCFLKSKVPSLNDIIFILFFIEFFLETRLNNILFMLFVG